MPWWGWTAVGAIGGAIAVYFGLWYVVVKDMEKWW